MNDIPIDIVLHFNYFGIIVENPCCDGHWENFKN